MAISEFDQEITPPSPQPGFVRSLQTSLPSLLTRNTQSFLDWHLLPALTSFRSELIQRTKEIQTPTPF